VCKIRQVNLRKKVRRPLHSFAALKPLSGHQGEDNIFTDGLPGQQLVKLLENEDSVRARRGYGIPLEQNASFNRLNITTDSFEDRRFPTAGRPKNYKAVRSKHAKADTICRANEALPCLVLQRDAFNAQQGSGRIQASVQLPGTP